MIKLELLREGREKEYLQRTTECWLMAGNRYE